MFDRICASIGPVKNVPREIIMFKNKKFSLLLLGMIAVLATSFILHGQQRGKSSFGSEIPEGTEITTLAQILQSPENFDGKTVVMEGSISGQCASRCKFNYREGNEVIEVNLNGFRPPSLDIGTRVRVSARVYSGNERVVISANGMKLL
ncbi:hypothetical protein CHISP_3684 [Chitinispirillum alkaliphilum]|nr:hypothetical protein CHISP_3684 [Chitinispirillum alkaliphilum]